MFGLSFVAGQMTTYIANNTGPIYFNKLKN